MVLTEKGDSHFLGDCHRFLIVLLLFLAVSVPRICYADFAAEGASVGGVLRGDAPIYSGTVDEDALEELTESDFAAFGTDEDTPADQYRRYKEYLENPASGSRVLYKMRIVDRDLTPDDFLAFDVPEKVSEARYEGYLSMISQTDDGRTIHYVYVYHSPLNREESESGEAEREMSRPISTE